MAAPDPDLLALNAATASERWGLGEIIAGCARHRIRGIAPLRAQAQRLGLKESARRCRDAGLTVTSLCHGGLFPALDGKARNAARDDNRRAVDEALELGAQCLIVVAGGLPRRPGGGVDSKDLPGARAMVRDGLGELLDYARSGGMPLALEPLHPMYAAERGCVNTMAQANDLCDELAGRNKGEGLGLAVDAYHVWWDPLLRQEIGRAANASPSRLLAFQISDWLAPAVELRLNRGMMGDGVIDLPLLRSWMENAGYHGMHEVEILSANDWWKRDPDEVLLTCRHRHQSAC